jgi:hypothetical protein
LTRNARSDAKSASDSGLSRGFSAARARWGSACEEPLGIAVEGFAYPHPVHMFVIQAGGERLSMAYMDVPPEGDSNGRIEGSKKQRTEETP